MHSQRAAAAARESGDLQTPARPSPESLAFRFPEPHPPREPPPHHGVQVELSLPLPLLLAPQTHVEQWDLLGGPWAGLQNQ